MHDVTLVSCNYNTPEQIQTMLKSWVVNCGDVSNNCLIMEHSTNDDSIGFYEENGIPYVRNRGAVHYIGVEAALCLVNTRYMLLVDSDVVFHKSLLPVIGYYMNQGINFAGRVEGDRGGYLLHKRIHPWYCYIDVEFVRKHSIRFADMNRVRSTSSEGFYWLNIPHGGPTGTRKHDVGSTFLEDVMKHKGKVFNHNIEGDYFTHFEGMSWRKNSGIESMVSLADEVNRLFEVEHLKYENISVKNFFTPR